MDARTHRSTNRRPRALALPVRSEISGRLVRRYKRFFADIETDSGEKLTVHCANPGSMRGCAVEGSRVRCSTSDNPKRKLRHTLEMVRVGRAWVGVHTTRANQFAALALENGAVPGLEGYAEVKREVGVGGGSRLDFALSEHSKDPRTAYVEVKSVTLAEGKLARFPDSVTERGRRHMDTLARLHKEGNRAVLLYVVQRADCEEVEPADDIDPQYGIALRRAVKSGVEVIAVRARLTARAISLDKTLPVRL